MSAQVSEQEPFENIPFKMHPRVFSSLGTDLVTDDVVAVLELVKNSYDAFASKVFVRFGSDPKEGNYLEIEDDGLGMTRSIVENVWCMVATPYKENHIFIENHKKKRRVVGEKGLGRLSAARLGKRLHMLTKASNSPCLEVLVDWDGLASENNVASCFAQMRNYSEEAPFDKTGTRIRIYDLKEIWTEEKILDLEDNLGRLISPFAKKNKIKMFVQPPGRSQEEPVKIQTPEFLNSPKYVVRGYYKKNGLLNAVYKFNPIREGKGRTAKLKYSWEQIVESGNSFEVQRIPFDKKKSHCGSFTFEIRAWDIATDDTREISEVFSFQQSRVRKSIKAHKGISVYRDSVLVLPKSENARDWLGLDLRRVSKVGTRLSTSQIVGYVSLTKKGNPGIDDTSDRERLANNMAVFEFEAILKTAVVLLEQERDEDRPRKNQEKLMEDLFGKLSADKLVEDVSGLASEGADANEVVPIIKAYKDDLDTAREEIKERFTFYSRIATVGTIAQTVVHEIRNRTTAFGEFLETSLKFFSLGRSKEFDTNYEIANGAVHTLERLADNFAPLATKGFRRRLNRTILEERIYASLALLRDEIKNKDVECEVPEGETKVAVDPGELDAILVNLISNSAFWLGQEKEKKRKISFKFKKINNDDRIRVWVHDNGPGFSSDEAKKVFLPGFTKKPGGIGMGLTVASELVAQYEGEMICEVPGSLGGASFGFDIPLQKK